VLTPEVDSALKIMKLANQQSHLFIENGSEVTFLVGFVAVFIAIFNMFLGVVLLTFQHSINHCIVHFIALHVISEVSCFYFEALAVNNSAMEVVKELYPKQEIKGKDINFFERSYFHMIARLVYKLVRAIYVSAIFYFIPFASFMIHFMFYYPPEVEGAVKVAAE
jgi:hypothetical protein